MDENSEFTKPEKINFFRSRSRDIKFSILGGFLTNIFAFSLIPNEKKYQLQVKIRARPVNGRECPELRVQCAIDLNS